MATAERLEVQLIAPKNPFSKSMDYVDARMDKTNQGANKLGKSIKNAFGSTGADSRKAGSSLQSFGRSSKGANNVLGAMGGKAAIASTALAGMGIVAVGLTVGLAKLVKPVFSLASSFSRMAMDVIESENLVSVAFGEMTGDIIEWSEKLDAALGINAREARKNAAVIYSMTRSMNLGQKTATEMSKGVVQLSEDFVSLHNVAGGSDRAMRMIQSGLAGQGRSLADYGIMVNESTIAMMAQKHGIAELGTQMTDAQKVMARYLVIADGLKDAQGDLARTIGSPTNQLRIMQGQIKAISQNIGFFFIPVLARILPYLNAFLTIVSRIVVQLARFFNVDLQPLARAGNNLSSMADNANAFGSAMDDANKSTKALSKSLAGFDELNVLNKDTGQAGLAGSVGGGAFDFDFSAYDMGLDDIQSKTDAIVNKITEKWDDLKTKLREVKEKYFDPIGLKMKEIYEQYFEKYITKLSELFDEKIKPKLEWLEEKFTRTFNITPLMLFGIALIAMVVVPLFALALVLTMITVLVIVAIAVVALFVAGWIAVGLIIGWVLKQIANMFFKAIEYGRRFISFLGYLARSGWEAGKAFGNGMSNAMKSAMDAMKTNVRSALRWIIDRMNRFITAYNSRVGRMGRFGGESLQVDPIPQLAKGGLVTGNTLANIGEGGYNEVVLPLERNTGWAEKVAELISGQNGVGTGNAQPITINLGNRTLYEGFINEQNDSIDSSGVYNINI